MPMGNTLKLEDLLKPDCVPGDGLPEGRTWTYPAWRYLKTGQRIPAGDL